MNEPTRLSAEELERYARHIVLPEVGGAGQQRLKQARVLVVGAGGLGSPVIQYLAAAGIGTIGVVDDDRVTRSNLQRQVIHDTASVGSSKLDSAAASVARINPHVSVEKHDLRLDAENAPGLVAAYDIIVDGSDNFDTRYAVADACEAAMRPLVHAAVGRFDGSVTVLTPYQTGPDGILNPSYRTLFPEPPPPGLVPSCAEAGVLGVLAGVIGTLQAMEAIKIAAGIGEPLVGRLLLYDALSARFDTINYRRSTEDERDDITESAVSVERLTSSFDRWQDVLDMIRTAFAAMEGKIDPPSSADSLTAETLRDKAGEETVYVAKFGERLIGCAFLDDRGDHLYLGKLAVAPSYQGFGVGRRLIEAAEGFAASLGKTAIELQTRVELTGNQAAFARMGYVEVARTAHPGFDRPTSVTMRKTVR